MPIVNSDFRAPRGLRNPHLQTIAPTLLRRVNIDYHRERLELDDGDFLDLDWVKNNSRRLLIISHGLEGSSYSSYVKGAAKYFSQHGWDILAWNFRGCGGEPNRLPRFYHSGSSDDLDAVVQYSVKSGNYESIGLLGFSMGGNQTLLYLSRHNVPVEVKAGVALSVPCDLAGCADRLSEPDNRLYMNRFIKDLSFKLKRKAIQFPDTIDQSNFHQIKNFHHFDARYTAPLHGFKDHHDYWHQCSSSRYLSSLQRATLLINALDDPFLSSGCFPTHTALKSKQLFLEAPSNGGHVGFMNYHLKSPFWSEKRAMTFLCERIN